MEKELNDEVMSNYEEMNDNNEITPDYVEKPLEEEQDEKEPINLDFFNVRGCKVTSDMVFNGVVLRVGDEDIIISIKRHLGIKGKLMCELTGETFGVNKADVYSVKLQDLVVGDLMVLLGNTNFLNI